MRGCSGAFKICEHSLKTFLPLVRHKMTPVRLKVKPIFSTVMLIKICQRFYAEFFIREAL